MMKKFLMMVAVAMMTAITANAQRILVVDSEGHGIPLVSVLTESGTLIGTTDLDGVVADVRGAKRVTVTHVAYKAKQVSLSGLTDGRITLEDLDYSLGEVVVKPKPYIYVETYYRVYVYRNDSLGYFHCGIMPNAFDPKLKKLEHGSYDQCYLEFAASMGVAINWGARGMRFAGKVHNYGFPSKENLKKRYFVTTDDSDPNHWIFSNPEGKLGQLVHVGSQVHTTLDAGKMQMYANKMKGETKKLKNREEKEYEYQYTLIGRNKEEGEEASFTDFIMETDHWEYTDKKGHAKFIIECYATERGYMDKDEFKAKKKELKEEYKKVSKLEDFEPYEQQHNIPALPASVRQAISKLKSF